MTTEAAIDQSEPNGEPFGMSLQATAWSRFWARLLDIQIEGGAISLALLVVFPGFLANELFQGSGGNVLYGLLLLPAILLLDGVVQGIFGQTIGKAVVGINAETIRHGKIGIALSIRRNFSIYVNGITFGIPIINLFGLISSFNDVKGNLQTIWDREYYT